MSGTSSAAWLEDPSRRHQYRYWDGQKWTDHVSDNGATTLDPIEGQGQRLPAQESTPSTASRQDLAAVSTIDAKLLQNAEPMLQAALEPGESYVRICRSGRTFASAYALSNRRILEFTKKKISGSFRLEDLRSKEIFKNPYFHFLWIYTHSYFLDYAPDDSLRMDQMIQFKHDTLRPILEVDELIASLLVSAGLEPLPQVQL